MKLPLAALLLASLASAGELSVPASRAMTPTRVGPVAAGWVLLAHDPALKPFLHAHALPAPAGARETSVNRVAPYALALSRAGITPAAYASMSVDERREHLTRAQGAARELAASAVTAVTRQIQPTADARVRPLVERAYQDSLDLSETLDASAPELAQISGAGTRLKAWAAAQNDARALQDGSRRPEDGAAAGSARVHKSGLRFKGPDDASEGLRFQSVVPESPRGNRRLSVGGALVGLMSAGGLAAAIRSISATMTGRPEAATQAFVVAFVLAFGVAALAMLGWAVGGAKKPQE